MLYLLHTHPSFFWIAIGVVFITAELGTPGLFYFLSFAIGSFAAAFTSWLEYGLDAQSIAFLITTIFSTYFLKKYAQQSISHSKTNTEALIGQHGVVLKPVSHSVPGTIKIKGDEWTALCTQRTTLHPGTSVVVVTIDGNKLIVS